MQKMLNFTGAPDRIKLRTRIPLKSRYKIVTIYDGEGGLAQTCEVDRAEHVRFSNRPSRTSTFRLTATAMSTPLTGSCFSSESAQGPSIMGFEDERDNLYRGLVVSSNGRSKRTCELISSIGPRGTSFHC